MSKVLFTVQYEIKPEFRSEYLNSIKELKMLIKPEGLESYSVYEVKGKPNNFQEIYLFSSEEAYEAYEDSLDERTNLLISKITEMTLKQSSKYSTLVELQL
jgi:antibiotic biosynthesis monooxygenase (ABM) superfamily enzyme